MDKEHDEFYKQLIKDNIIYAKNIVREGKFYGYTVDVNNLEELVAVLYNLYQLEKLKKSQKNNV